MRARPGAHALPDWTLLAECATGQGPATPRRRYGFLFNPHAYLKDAWCQLDITVVTLAWLPILLPTVGNYSVIRAVREQTPPPPPARHLATRPTRRAAQPQQPVRDHARTRVRAHMADTKPTCWALARVQTTRTADRVRAAPRRYAR